MNLLTNLERGGGNMIYKQVENKKKERNPVLTSKEKETMTRRYAILMGYEEGNLDEVDEE